MTTLPADWPNRAYSRLVRSGGIEWHVQEAGAGPVLLLIHGTGAATHSWRDVLPLAVQRFRVVAIDLPGHGFTTGRPAGGLTLPAVGRAVTELCVTLDVLPALLVGHSAGAAVAIQMALDGMAAKGIVAIAPALLPFPGIAQLLFPTMAKLLFVNPFAPHIAAQIARGEGTVEKFLKRATCSTIDAVGAAAYRRLFTSSAHCAGAIGMMADWNLEPLKAALPDLAVPLLVLHGERDAAIPVSAAREATALVPGATIEVTPGLGHLLHEEAPQATVERVVRFAAEVGVLDEQENAAWIPHTTG